MASLLSPACRALGILTLAGLCGTVAFAAEQAGTSTESAASLVADQYPAAESHFAILLDGQRLPAAASRERDHVVLVDTSASQFGEHRTHTFEVLKAFLQSVPSGDRVQIMAIDVQVKPLTAGFVDARGAEVDAALASLARRAPLGATNIAAGVDAALQALAGDRPGTVLYLGDGMSSANLVDASELQTALADLREKQIPWNSYAAGPRTDLQLLGVLATQTGGALHFDSPDQARKGKNAEQVGQALAAAVIEEVYFPKSITVNTEGVQILPQAVLPMRRDRETLYVGQGDLTAGVQVDVELAQGGESQTLAYAFDAAQVETGYTFLRAQWKQVEKTDGLLASLSSRNMLYASQSAFDHEVAQLVQVGEQAVAARNLDQAEAIGLTLRELDPENVPAQALINAAGRLKVETVALNQPLPADQAPAPADSVLNDPGFEDRVAPPAANAQANILEAERRRRIKTQSLQLEVARAIEEARQLQIDEPDAARTILKSQLTTVQSVTDIEPQIRQQLIRQLQSEEQIVQNRQEVFEIQQIQSQERLAILEAQQRLIDQLVLDEERLEQLIDRVRALMSEAVHGNDDAYEEAEAVARAAVDLRPGDGTAAAALFTAEAAGQLNKAFRLRALRADRFLETLYQVELSHVPFPDEPPIRWPPAEVWKALTERRRKWASVDLHKNSPAEERIQEALTETTEFEFLDYPLKEAMDFLADQHGITIILDEMALEEDGIPTDLPITRVLSGISLRSALRIILEPELMTYIIKDEVMMITTQLKADEILSTRVYPVGDLVIPIVTPQMGGLGQGLGGTGGIGGMGMGGQFGGMGGGQFGGGLGAGFSVPAEKVPKKAAPQKIDDPEVEDVLNRVLERKTSQLPVPFAGQAFAQVQDPLPEKPFRLDNRTVEELKKKQENLR